MGSTMIPVKFFSDAITIEPHTVSQDALKHLSKRTTLRAFAAGEPIALMEDEETGELTARTRSGRFITGREV